jgi:ABC-type phosphate/phosphonate transport system substrate-binding protein
LLFAKPFEACLMMKQYGFIPLARPIADADEVVILTRSDDTRSLSDYEGVSVGTATKDSFVYLLGRFLCDENGLDSAKFVFDFSGNEIKALQTLIRKKCDLVFMLKKTYEGLSSFSKNNVRKLDESQTDFACHFFCVAPHLQEQGEALVEVLLEMAQEEQGEKILQDIQIQGWTRPEEGELKMLQMVCNRYVV